MFKKIRNFFKEVKETNKELDMYQIKNAEYKYEKIQEDVKILRDLHTVLCPSRTYVSITNNNYHNPQLSKAIQNEIDRKTREQMEVGVKLR